MRKIWNRVCMTAAAAAIAGSWTVPAHGAYASYPVPGGKVVVVGGSLGNLKDLAEQIGAAAGGDCGILQPDGGRPGWPGRPERPEKPEEPEVPENPETPEIPGEPERPNQPELPENPGQPETPGRPETPELPETPQEPETPNQPDSGETGTMDEFAVEVVRLINKEREKAGLSPLTVNVQAAEAAQVRAREIETAFSHTRPDGTSFVTALKEAGAVYRGAGENIAYGQRTPEQVMEVWMNSQGHRANILNPSFTSVGVGHYQNSRGVSYWTQLFIR